MQKSCRPAYYNYIAEPLYEKEHNIIVSMGSFIKSCLKLNCFTTTLNCFATNNFNNCFQKTGILSDWASVCVIFLCPVFQGGKSGNPICKIVFNFGKIWILSDLSRG